MLLVDRIHKVEHVTENLKFLGTSLNASNEWFVYLYNIKIVISKNRHAIKASTKVIQGDTDIVLFKLKKQRIDGICRRHGPYFGKFQNDGMS